MKEKELMAAADRYYELYEIEKKYLDKGEEPPESIINKANEAYMIMQRLHYALPRFDLTSYKNSKYLG